MRSLLVIATVPTSGTGPGAVHGLFEDGENRLWLAAAQRGNRLSGMSVAIRPSLWSIGAGETVRMACTKARFSSMKPVSLPCSSRGSLPASW